MKLGLTVSRSVRSLVGIVLGCVASSAIGAPLGGLAPIFSYGHGAYLPMFLLVSTIAIVLALPLGALIHAALYALGARSALAYIMVAAGFGLLFALLGLDFRGPTPPLVLYPAWLGLLALIAWLIRRPDRDDKAAPPETHF